MRVGLVPVGYADGYLRAFSNKAVMLLDGAVCPVIGRVSMDMTTIDVDARHRMRRSAMKSRCSIAIRSRLRASMSWRSTLRRSPTRSSPESDRACGAWRLIHADDVTPIDVQDETSGRFGVLKCKKPTDCDPWAFDCVVPFELNSFDSPSTAG